MRFEIGISQWAWQRQADGTFALPVAPVTPPTSDELVAYAHELHLATETGGTVWKGWPVKVDERALTRMLGERLAVQDGVRGETDPWTFEDGVAPAGLERGPGAPLPADAPAHRRLPRRLQRGRRRYRRRAGHHPRGRRRGLLRRRGHRPGRGRVVIYDLPGMGDRIGASIRRRLMKPAVLHPAGGGEPVPVRGSFEALYVKLDALGQEVDAVQAFAGGTASEFAEARQGDVLELAGRRWLLATGPQPYGGADLVRMSLTPLKARP